VALAASCVRIWAANCKRCHVEEKRRGKSREEDGEEEVETKERTVMDDLERELKAGLDVM
jgi:hypothetical protein